MLTVSGEMVSLEVSALASVTVTPPAGAGVPNVTGNGTDRVGPTETLAGSPIAPGGSTVTLAVVSGINGVAETWITAVPGATPVTGTVSVEGEPPFGRKVSCSGTVATPVALELKVTVIPLGGAAPERVSVKFCVAVPTIVRLGGAKLTVAVTWAGTTALV
jgi:hypothetical protein